MTCTMCQTSGLPATETGCQVCWCGIDLCVGCIPAHHTACEWLQRETPKPPARAKRRTPFPVIGRGHDEVVARRRTVWR